MTQRCTARWLFLPAHITHIYARATIWRWEISSNRSLTASSSCTDGDSNSAVVERAKSAALAHVRTMLMPSPSSAVQLDRDSTYLPEVWSLYTFGVVVILLRWAVRMRTVGLKGFQWDDYLSGVYLFLYSLNVAIVQITYYTGGNIDVTPMQANSISNSDRIILRYGSQLEFISWYSYPGSIWILKFMVLFFYRRLTLGILHCRTINFLFFFCAASWVALIVTVSVSCRPFHHNWQIHPLPGPECTFRAQNFWTLVFLNVLTDAALMAIPVPILWNLRVSRRRKIAVSILLLSGVFVISTAVVRAVATIGGRPSVININRWGFRETTIGLAAVSAPIICPIFTEAFWRGGPYNPAWRRESRWMELQARPLIPREEPGFGTWIGTFELNSLEEDEREFFKGMKTARVGEGSSMNKMQVV
ncbi:hypothetical protein NLU13_5330 [Sarocladium strictum]|uniref:Rhodopsin domain-containing protein n=1 Tax=Sarocladium strictum TaxID=5046 RepID=A0AA39L743_SARSR|nr:hypothetical protein NLU13_5330 [Sarocladium strictum]